MRCPRICAFGAVPLLLVAGCTAVPAEPARLTSTRSATVPEVVFTAAPRTVEDVDLCGLLSTGQARGLGLAPHGVPITSGSGECVWGSAPAADGAGVTVNAHRRLTFRTLLKQHSADAAEVDWRDGYPVFNATGDSYLDCEIYVGVAPAEAVRIEARVGVRSGADACELAEAVAAAALPRLPAA